MRLGGVHGLVALLINGGGGGGGGGEGLNTKHDHVMHWAECSL